MTTSLSLSLNINEGAYMEGQILGNRYELIERIGGGGMAVVYKARCHLLNRYVAIKILRREFTDDEEFVKRFRVEAQAAASLSHPNIVSIYDVGQQDDIHYIVMEYIDGITLKEYINQNGPLHWRDAVNIAVQICSAIETAHRNHIVHRDIKPHNILLTKDGVAKVTDFGIARAVTSATITVAGSTIGSVHYFSPEQARGGFIDEKSDLYSLGITIYEMVTGRVPFDGESPVAVALKHIQERAERPMDINPNIPKAVNDLIMKAIKKDQNLRYQTASEMLSDLLKTLNDPNATISDNGAIEDMPTKKIKAVGANLKIPDESQDYYDDEDIYDKGDEDIGRKNKKDKLSIWLGIVTGLIIAGIIFFIGMKLVFPVINPEETEGYVVVDFTNKDFRDVREELLKYDINAEVEEWVDSDTVPENIIISQTVSVGNKLKPGSTIKFKVSSGPKMVDIPDVVGKESRVGEQIIINAGLVPIEVKEHSETVPTGYIIRTDPEAYERVKPNESVTVYVSLGPKLEMVKVPNVLGLTRSEAEKKILQNKLTVGDILPEGIVSNVAKVVKQYPAPGEEVEAETPVELTFEVIEEPTNPDEQGGGTNTETPGNGEDSGTRKVFVTVSLPNPQNYGDEIMVYIEATPSDTNVPKVVYNQSVAKSNFPFSIEIDAPRNGTTHVIVMLDGVLVQETDK